MQRQHSCRSGIDLPQSTGWVSVAVSGQKLGSKTMTM